MTNNSTTESKNEKTRRRDNERNRRKNLKLALSEISAELGKVTSAISMTPSPARETWYVWKFPVAPTWF